MLSWRVPLEQKVLGLLLGEALFPLRILDLGLEAVHRMNVRTAVARGIGIRTTRTESPHDDRGTKSMLNGMKRLVERSFVQPVVRETAVSIVRSRHLERDYTAQIAALRNWLKQHVVFLRDPRGAELRYDPVMILRTMAAQGQANIDCDDAATLAAALGRSIGLKARFVAVAFLDKRAGFSHVWAELSAPVGPEVWYEMDVTRQAQQLPFNLISRTMVVPT